MEQELNIINDRPANVQIELNSPYSLKNSEQLKSKQIEDDLLNDPYQQNPIPAKSKQKQLNLCQKLYKLLTKEEASIEENEDLVSEEEQNRRYQLAIKGWKKVKSVLSIIQINRKMGQIENYQPVKKFCQYQNFLIMPFSKFKFYLTQIESFLILYNIIMVPYRYAFNNIDNITLQSVDMYMDIYFSLTVIIKFFCAYVDKTRLIKSLRLITLRYIFGFLWMEQNGLFLFELLCIFPYYFFNNYYGFRFLRILQIGLVLDLFQQFWNTLLSLVTSNINLTKSLTSILQFLLALGIIGQYLACFWYFLGIQENVEQGWDKDKKLLRMYSGWVHEQLYVGNSGYVGSNLQYEFIASLYWVFTTLTTLGYGDFYGQTVNEQIFTMFVEFIGVFVFAYMMGNINNLIEKLNDDHLEYIQNENENLDQWIIKIDRANPTRKLPQTFIDDLRKRFTIYWQKDHTTVVQEYPFFNQLPVDLRGQLVNHIFKGFIDRFQVFFKGLETSFIQAVVVNLYPKKFTQVEHEGRRQIDIIPIDTCPNDLFFITKGNVTIASNDGVLKYLTLGQDSYFGDHLILFNLKSSNAFMAIEEDVECMCINKQTFLELCDFYPYSHKVLKFKAYARRKHFREVKLKVMQNEDNQRQKYNITHLNEAENDKKDKHDIQFQIDVIERNQDHLIPDFIKIVDDEGQDTAQQKQSPINKVNKALITPVNNSSQFNPIEEQQKNEIIKLAKDLNDKIEHLKSALSQLDNDVKVKVQNIKTELEFIARYEEVIHGYDEDNQ